MLSKIRATESCSLRIELTDFKLTRKRNDLFDILWKKNKTEQYWAFREVTLTRRLLCLCHTDTSRDRTRSLVLQGGQNLGHLGMSTLLSHQSVVKDPKLCCKVLVLPKPPKMDSYRMLHHIANFAKTLAISSMFF